MADAAWASFLDTLESELQAVDRAEAERGRKVTPFAAPDLGPLPAELADRARALLEQVRAAEAEVRADMARTTVQLRELRHMDPRAPRPPSSIDTRA